MVFFFQSLAKNRFSRLFFHIKYGHLKYYCTEPWVEPRVGRRSPLRWRFLRVALRPTDIALFVVDISRGFPKPLR